MTTVILRTAAKVLVPLSLIFAFFVFFKGHQYPGGGFVGGLVASMAIVVHRLANGPASVRRLMPCSESVLIGVGLSCALLTGTGALLLGLPFMTSDHGYWPLPGGGGSFEWATVMGFDLGVMLVVTGVVVGMINALSEELD